MKPTISFLFLLFFISTLRFSFGQEKNAIALKTFDKIIETMKQNYFDQSYHGLQWGELTVETRKKISEASTLAEAYNEIPTLLKKLGHSHLEFYSPYQKKNKIVFQDFKGGGAAKEIPFRFMIHEKSLLITEVVKGSDAWSKGLRPGMVVEKIGKDKVEDIINESQVHSSIAMVFFSFNQEEIKFSGKDTNDKNFEIQFKFDKYQGALSSFGNIKNYPVDTKFEIINDNIGYIRFNIFLFDAVKTVIDAINDCKEKKCKGIIIDVRNNPGGIGMLACAIAKEFCKTNYQLGVQHTTANNGLKELRFPVQPQPTIFEGPLIILVNESSASTSEILAIGMQENKSALVVGTKTPGLALPSLILELEDGSFFQYPIADFKTPKNQSLEGIGVIPDYTVKLRPEKIAMGEDEQITKAIELIKKVKLNEEK